MGNISPSPAEYHHLILCDRCRQLYLGLTEIHATLERSWSDLRNETAVSPESALDDREVLLMPVTPSLVPDTYRLAAMGEQPADPYLLFSFHNSERDILARILQDRENGRVRLYLVAKNLEAIQGLRVVLEDSGLEGITDLAGCIDFGIHPQLELTSVRIFSPAAIFSVAGIEEKFPDKDKHQFIVKNADEEEVMIELERGQPANRLLIRSHKRTAHGETVTLQVVAITNVRTIIGMPEQGVTVLETDGEEKVLKLLIY